jgi:hypothetical protein
MSIAESTIKKPKIEAKTIDKYYVMCENGRCWELVGNGVE